MYLLLILLGTSIVLYAVGSILHYRYEVFDDAYMIGDGFKFVGFLIAGILVLLLVVVIPISRIDTQGDIQSFEATKTTVEIYRRGHADGVEDIEKAALSKKIVEANNWLAQVQYFRQHPFIGIFYPPEVMELRPIY